MLRLAKAFWDISIWKRTPAQLPASLFLLGLVAGIAALLEDLDRAGLRFKDLQTTQSSLEDIFVSLVRKDQ